MMTVFGTAVQSSTWGRGLASEGKREDEMSGPIRVCMAVAAFSLPLTQALTIPWKFPIKIYEVSLLVALTFWLLQGRWSILPLARKPLRWLAVLAVWSVGSIFGAMLMPGEGFSHGQIEARFGATADSVTKLVYLLLNMGAFVMFSLYAARQPHRFLQWWLWGALFSGLYSIYLAGVSRMGHTPFLLPGMAENPQAMDGVIRCGTFLEGNYAGLYFLVSLAIALFLKRWWIAGILLLAVFTTYSTINLAGLGLLAALFFASVIRQTSFSLQVVVALTLFGLLAAGGAGLLLSSYGRDVVLEKLQAQEDTIEAQSRTWRSDTAQAAWKIFLDNPVLGVGLSQFTYYYSHYSNLEDMKVLKEKEIVNNIYLEILCETGVFGFIFFGLFLWEMFAVCRQLPLKTLSFAFWVILLIWFGFPSFSLMFQWAFFGGLIGLITFGQQAESAREHGIA